MSIKKGLDKEEKHNEIIDEDQITYPQCPCLRVKLSFSTVVSF